MAALSLDGGRPRFDLRLETAAELSPELHAGWSTGEPGTKVSSHCADFDAGSFGKFLSSLFVR